jgi:hypothetical protein
MGLSALGRYKLKRYSDNVCMGISDDTRYFVQKVPEIVSMMSSSVLFVHKFDQNHSDNFEHSILRFIQYKSRFLEECIFALVWSTRKYVQQRRVRNL